MIDRETGIKLIEAAQDVAIGEYQAACVAFAEGRLSQAQLDMHTRKGLQLQAALTRLFAQPYCDAGWVPAELARIEQDGAGPVHVPARETSVPIPVTLAGPMIAAERGTETVDTVVPPDHTNDCVRYCLTRPITLFGVAFLAFGPR